MDYTGVKQSDKVILMKCTSRGRPDQMTHTMNEYLRLANNPAKMLFILSLDEDDQTNIRYVADKIYLNPHSNKITAINSNVPLEGWDILLNISDDQVPIVQGYDDIIRNAMPYDLDHSLWFNDGWQNRINTQEIVGYNYYKRFGYIYHPEYKSFFCDNESTEVAKKLGKSIYSHQCIIRHDHPLWNKQSHVPHDALYKANDKYWDHDQKLFKQREANGFT